MKIFKRGLITLAALAVCLALVVAANTWRQPSRQQMVAAVMPAAIDEQAAARRLAEGTAFRTISFAPGLPLAAEEFAKLHAHLEARFPKAHAVLKKEIVAGASLLYTWAGSDPAAKPIMLMAHQDVVPIAPGTEGQWTKPPFDGVVADGFIWGRGSWDDKGNLYAIMEAVEMLAGQGIRPRQTVLLAFGHDEEIGGRGAQAIAAQLQAQGVKLDFVLDEGLLITEGLMKGASSPIALVGIAEKGYLSLELTATATPGHSSMPPQDTAIGTLSAAIARLQASPMPAALSDVARGMFGTLAPDMQGANRILLSNLWLFAPLVRRELEKSPTTNALMRTTMAPTILRAGEKDNVLPGRAYAVINFRLLPGDTIAGVTERVSRLAGPAVTVSALDGGSEASPVSPVDARGFRTIERTVRELFAGTLVAPGLMIAATDSRHMTALTDQIYRFSPVRARPDDLARFHGTNERISIANYASMIGFYHRLLARLSEPAIASR